MQKGAVELLVWRRRLKNGNLVRVVSSSLPSTSLLVTGKGSKEIARKEVNRWNRTREGENGVGV